MRYLIDGYNLMHALGMAPTPGGLSLERSRLRMLEWLAVELGKRTPTVTIIFDAQHSAGGEQSFRGIRIRFANARTADDFMEELIQSENIPNDLTVVSNDHRIQTAATRGCCRAWNCGQFIDWVQASRSAATNAPENRDAEKPATPSRDELDEWLERFGT